MTAEYIFGSLANVKEGDYFKDRKALREVGIHKVLQAGIDGNPKVGATSIVLNGGYVDDLDLGDEIIYTGHGGNDPNSKRQIQDQSWESPGNKALLISEMHGLPIRVTRGHRHKSPLSPEMGYIYCGLYTITDHFEEKGKDGFLICRYRLIKNASLLFDSKSVKTPFSGGSDGSKRIPSTVLRIIRDTKLSREIKRLYDYTCQLCGTRISVRGIGYAEAAHIRPLGKPHNGHDKPENLLCLCPNHHVMFDKGVFMIDQDLKVVGLNHDLMVHEDHKIDCNNLKYHEEHIYINHKYSFV